MRVNAGQYIPENWEEELGLVSTESAMTTYQQRLDEGEETWRHKEREAQKLVKRM